MSRPKDFDGLMRAASLEPATLAARTGIHLSTIYRIRAGNLPRRPYLSLLAVALRSTPEKVKASIVASAGASR